jgi:hypothetical protein
MQGNRYLFLIVMEFKGRYSTHNLKDWSFFLTNKVGQSQGEEHGWMYPLSKSYFNCTFNSANSLGVILYSRMEIGVILGYNSMLNSTSRSGGMSGKLSEKTSGNSQTTWMSSRFWAVVWWTEGGATEGCDSLWQNHLRNEGSVFQDLDRVILDEARMHVNTHTKHSKP